nr:ABC transporter ATP-binding protein [Bacilli bacterium]
MIELKNVSKFYYQNGIIASGFTKVNLKLNIGEFVVITGESGSGKSTLLNVISGLDTYEEGEMYINGEETSHYREVDFEDYRRKYIGNIFQNFNLVNSYTVYQNVELVLLLNGSSKKDIKDKVLDIIDTVGLKRYKNTKVSKLSGGQKQRVAIARALAKETPIIVADEPTGNLDTKSAKQIMKLLHEVSKDKLVIIVTHNKEQVEEYATRLIQMHDGKILEDKVIEKVKNDNEIEIKEYKNITILNRLRLGFRNTFNIFTKFILILFVFFFISEVLLFEYTSLRKRSKDLDLTGANVLFTNSDTKRIVIKKNDNSEISKSDLEELGKIDHVKRVVEDDVLLDTNITLRDNEYYYYLDGNVDSISSYEGDLTYGRMPEKDNEVIALAAEYDWYLTDDYENVLETEFNLTDAYGVKTATKIRIVGIKISDTYRDRSIYYVSDKLLNNLRFANNEEYSNVTLFFEGKYYTSESYNRHIVPSNNVPSGYAYVSDMMEVLCPYYDCVNRPLKISVSNIYYSQDLNITVSKEYTKNNFKNILNTDINYEDTFENIYVNTDDYNKLFNKATYQSSVFVDDEDNAYLVNDKLTELGYKTLVIKDSIVNDGRTVAVIMQIFTTIFTVGLIVALFFISYFVIKIILKSRSIYFTTIRILGANKCIAKQILDIELFLNSTLAYILCLVELYLVKIDVLKLATLKKLVPFISLKEIIIMYVILIVMSQLISNRFSRKIFKNSVMKTMAEEVR